MSAIERIAILGPGRWGLALAHSLHFHRPVTVLGRPESEAVASLRRTRTWKGQQFPLGIHYETLDQFHESNHNSADLLILAVPSHALSEISTYIEGFRGKHIVIATKGLNHPDGRLISEVLRPRVRPGVSVSVLTGPNIALEVIQQKPTTAVVASPTLEISSCIASCFPRYFRVYRSTDLVGCQIAGALKNIIAVVAGVVRAAESDPENANSMLGANPFGSICSRALWEMMILGKVLGARASTFLSVAGTGDLITTTFSPISRNYQAGQQLYKTKIGLQWNHKVGGEPAEGVTTSYALNRLSEDRDLLLPVFNGIHKIITEPAHLPRTINQWMSRDLGEVEDFVNYL